MGYLSSGLLSVFCHVLIVFLHLGARTSHVVVVTSTVDFTVPQVSLGIMFAFSQVY